MVLLLRSLNAVSWQLLRRNAIKQADVSQTTTTLTTFAITNAYTRTITRICSRSCFFFRALVMAHFLYRSHRSFACMFNAGSRTPLGSAVAVVDVSNKLLEQSLV